MPSATDVTYGVSPYSYLATQSPTDKNAPTNVRAAKSRGSDSQPPQEDDEPTQMPYNYLNPHGPVPFQRDGSIRPKEQSVPMNLRRDPETGNTNAVANPAYQDGGYVSGSSPGDVDTMNSQFYPPRREDTLYHSGSHQRQPRTKPPSAREKPYTIPETEYKIPRPQLNGSGKAPDTDYQDQHERPYMDNDFAPVHKDPEMNVSRHHRPYSSDETLDPHYKSKGGGRRRACCVLGIILIVVLCLGAGFIAGWFASDFVNGDNGGSRTTLPTLTTTTAARTTTSPVATTTTTTAPTTTNAPSTSTTVGVTTQPLSPTST